MIRRVNPLKTTYQRNLSLGTIIAALLLLIPLLIWYGAQDHGVAVIAVEDILEIGPGLKAEPDAERSGAGPRADGRKGYSADISGMSGAFTIVPDEPSPYTDFDFQDITRDPIPEIWIDESRQWRAEGPDEFEIRPGTPDGDGWPIKGRDVFDFQPIGRSGFNAMFSNEIIEPKKNRKPFIQLGAQRWPKNAARQGYYTAVIKVKLYIDENSRILDKHGDLMCRVLEENPKDKGFREAFFEMLRNGFYQCPIIENIPYGYMCTITYEFCNGANCNSFVEVVSGDVTASVEEMKY